MKVKNHDKVFKVLSVVLLVFWLLLIFYFSNQKGSVSESKSDFIIKILNDFFNFLSLNIDLNHLKNISFIIRKLAHLFLYFVLYFLIYFVGVVFNFKKQKLFLFFCFLYAISDEIHQSFIKARSADIRDVLIDTLGSFLALVCLNLILKIKERLKK